MKWTEKYRVSNLDTDMNRVLSLTGIMRYMQDTAFFHMEGKKPSYEDLFSRGKAFMLNRLTLSVYKSVKSHEEINVETWLAESGTSALTFDHCFRIIAEGEVAAEAITVWSLFNFEERKFVKTADFEGKYCTDKILPLEVPKRLHIPKDISMSPVGNYTVCYRDLDMNKHMNNTVYGNLFCGYIPDMAGKEVVKFDMNYRNEVHEGENIKVYMSECVDGGYYFRSMNGEVPNAEAYIKVAEIL